MISDSLTFDEKAHIGAGFSYLAKQDYRLNPEHPPLVKDLAALPLLFLNLNFPDTHPAWLQKDEAPPWWVQFDFGRELLYSSGNDPAKIIFWARIIMISLLIFLGWLLFWWTKKMTGGIPALLVLSLFTFSPEFLAHGRLVTTDVGAALGALIAIIFWLKFLQNPSLKNVIFAGLTFGLAQLFKFTLLLLIPFFIIITIIYIFLFTKKELSRGKIFFSYFGKAILAGLIGFLFIIWPIYQFNVWHYPIEQQVRDTRADISSNPASFAKEITIWMAGKEFLRAPAQYFRGILMALQRSAWGNTTYFLGQISAEGWRYYFPLIYLFKLPLAFHFLSILAIILFFVSFLKKKLGEKIKLTQNNFWIFAIFFWVIFYWIAAIKSNLNIGLRHLIPVLPFTYILVVLAIYQSFQTISKKINRLYFILVTVLLFSWYIFSSILTFPHYLSYFNELGGGIKNGHKIAVDSNYDWGQDFYRLIKFVEENKIDKIYLDYFGGEESEYWLKEKYVRFDPKEMKGPPKGWLAVSSNHLMGGVAKPKKGFDQETSFYDWLEGKEPFGRAGYSIFIYYFD
ncbi:MAG: glycosyltransferase family 39 protein [Patescibacteria group bacterium]